MCCGRGRVRCSDIIPTLCICVFRRRWLRAFGVTLTRSGMTSRLLKNCFEGCTQAAFGGGLTLAEVARAACGPFCEARDFHWSFVRENFNSLLDVWDMN